MAKIKLGEAIAGGATRVLFHCEARDAGGVACPGAGEIDIGAAIMRWGEARALDALPAFCSRCGSRKVEVRPYYPRYRL
jgi:hypothetical protein